GEREWRAVFRGRTDFHSRSDARLRRPYSNRAARRRRGDACVWPTSSAQWRSGRKSRLRCDAGAVCERDHYGEGRGARAIWRGVAEIGEYKMKKPSGKEGFCFIPGNFLLSHTLARAVPSGLRGLTSVFGMGTGGSLSLRSPRT